MCLPTFLLKKDPCQLTSLNNNYLNAENSKYANIKNNLTNTALKMVNKINIKNRFKAASHNTPFKKPS